MGEGHVEIVRLAGDRAGLQIAAFVAADRLHLAGIADGFLTNDRDIAVRYDD